MKLSTLTSHQEYRLRTLYSVFCHALPHRRKGGLVAGHLVNNVRMTWLKKKRHAFCTHCELAKRRNAQHRNTSRDLLRELEQMQFIQVYSYRPKHGTRYAVMWSRVHQYAADHKVGLATAPAGSDDTLIRTKADWDAEREREADRRRKAIEARTNDEREQRQRQDAEAAAMPIEQRRQQWRALKEIAGLRRVGCVDEADRLERDLQG